MICLLSCALLARSTLAYSEPIKGDGQLHLLNLHTDEVADAQFRGKHGIIHQNGVKSLKNVLRCRVDDEQHDISIKLLDIVDAIEDHFQAPHIEVISGYRSPTFNNELIAKGHKVAHNSLHTHGLAMDIRIPGVSTAELRDYALELHAGGVGFYPTNGFVHVDVGTVRYWTDQSRGKRRQVAKRPQKTQIAGTISPAATPPPSRL